MRPFFSFLLAGMLLPFCGCSYVSKSSRADSTASLELDRTEQKYRAAYQREHRKYEIAQKDLPAFEVTDVPDVKRRLVLIDARGIRLTLTLGPRRTVPATTPTGRPATAFRTGSRYRLSDSKGHVLATAESAIALDDLANNPELGVVLFADSPRHAYLISEEQSWSVNRYILIRSIDDVPAGSAALPKTWTVTYLRLPSRNSLIPVLSNNATVLGFQAGHVYLKQDGRIYAFPVDVLKKETNLAYSPG